MEEHNKLRQRLRDLTQRHNEFRHVIKCCDYPCRIPCDSNLEATSDLLGKLSESAIRIV